MPEKPPRPPKVAPPEDPPRDQIANAEQEVEKPGEPEVPLEEVIAGFKQTEARPSTAPFSNEPKDEILPSFSARTEMRMDQDTHEFTGAVLKDLPPEQVRVRIKGDMPDGAAKTDSLAEARGRLQSLIHQAGQKDENHSVLRDESEKPLSDAEVRMQEIEDRLKAQTKKFYSRKNRLLRLGHAELRKTELEYNRALFELAKSKKSSENLSGLEIVNDVIRKGVEAKREARKQALSVDDRYAFEKALELIPLGNKWMETNLGKNRARAMRALITAVAVVSGGAALGAFGTASIGALLGYGAYKAGRTFGSAVLGAAAVKVSSKWLDRVLGRKQARVQEELSQTSFEGEPDAKAFEQIRLRIEKLIDEADDKTVARKKLIYQGLIAMGVGGGANAFLTAFDIGMPFIDSATEKPTVGTSGVPGTTPAPVPTPEPLVRAEPVQPVPSPEPAAPAPAPVVESPKVAAPKIEVERIERHPAEVTERTEPAPLDGSGMTTAELNQASLAEGGYAIDPSVDQGVGVPYEQSTTEAPQDPAPYVPEPAPEAPAEAEIPAYKEEVASTPADIEAEPIEEILPPVDEVEASVPDEAPIEAPRTEDPVAPRPEQPVTNEAVATPTPAASPDVPEAYEAERSGSTSEASPVRELSPFVNVHNLPIDPRVPSVYSDANGNITAYGGSFAERFDAAQTYAQKHPGTIVHLESSRPLPGEDGVLRPWIARISVDPGSRQLIADSSPAGPAYVGLPDPQTFTALAR